MNKNCITIGEIIEKECDGFTSRNKLHSYVKGVLKKIKICLTRFMGGHKLVCPTCGHTSIHYNSCRNRNCPKCQNHERFSWIKKQVDLLLPVPYFHIIFTLPHELNKTLMHNQKVGYDALLKAVAKTLTSFGNTRGVKLGITIMLHTWSAALDYHVHAHVLVTGGGIDKEGNWKQISRGKYLFNVNNLSKCFRAKFLSFFPKELIDNTTRKTIFEKSWNVFSKRCSDGSSENQAETVISYLGRYFNRAPIANSRIVEYKEGEYVTFKYKNYRDKSLGEGFYPIKTITLSIDEFMRRLAMHFLPVGMHKVKHIGLHAPGCRKKLKFLQTKMGVKISSTPAKEKTIWICPKCNDEMEIKNRIKPDPPPPVLLRYSNYDLP